MGTRSLTHVKDADFDSQTLVTIYKQFDGYPDGLGRDLWAFLKETQICNGFGKAQETGKWANGSGCLAAQLITFMKEGIGNVYIYPPDISDCGEEFIYTIYFIDSVIYIRCYDVYNKKIVYGGPISEWGYSEVGG